MTVLALPSEPASLCATAAAVADARAAQPAWAATPLQERLNVLRRLRHRLGERPDDFAAAVTMPQRRNVAETLSAEVLPLADALKWLEAEAPSILAPRRLPNRRRPTWLTGVRVTERRDPRGVVLILGTWNYPLFLTGVQAAQALAAGNAVLLKPGRGAGDATAALRDGLVAAGLDPRLCGVLPEGTAAAEAAIAAGVDFVVLTGAADTGRAVLSRLADTLTPAAMELSGCDAVFVQADADLTLAVKSLSLGMTLNGSATCVAPRRVFVPRPLAAALEARIAAAFETLPAAPVAVATADVLCRLVSAAVSQGARRLAGQVESCGGGLRSVRPFLIADAPPDADLLKSDLFAPVLSLIPVDDDDEALRLNRKCPYALGATVFGGGHAAALAARIDAGCVVVNDFLIPTADPRVAFGGRRQSGYGVTRGAAGLLEMTQLKTVVERRSNWRPHLEPTTDADADFFRQYLAAAHGSRWQGRAGAGLRFLKQCFKRQRRT